MRLRLGAPRFAVFMLLFGLVAPITGLRLGPTTGLLVGFDVGAVAFLALVWPMMNRADASTMRASSAANDASRWLTLGMGVVTVATILAAVGVELTNAPVHRLHTLLAAGTVVLTWFFANTFFALHYAHLYYDRGDAGGDRQGLLFPGHCPEPDYWDFTYFSFILGMAFQTSDVMVTSTMMRRVVLGQSLAGFFFNIFVVSMSVSLLASSLAPAAK